MSILNIVLFEIDVISKFIKLLMNIYANYVIAAHIYYAKIHLRYCLNTKISFLKEFLFTKKILHYSKRRQLYLVND